MNRKITIGLVTASLTLAPMICVTPAAHASLAEGVVLGLGVPGNDWGDEGELARDSFPNSNATGIWQRVLVADGYLSPSDVDCRFGSKTETATRNWQRDEHLGVDGRVGPATFGRADDKLVGDGTDRLIYQGKSRDSLFIRNDSTGRYYIYVVGGSPQPAYYRSRSSGCTY